MDNTQISLQVLRPSLHNLEIRYVTQIRVIWAKLCDLCKPCVSQPGLVPVEKNQGNACPGARASAQQLVAFTAKHFMAEIAMIGS